ncbi:aminoacyl-tRNA hydrolase, partial [Candidatus Woesearchaeota archaeon CG10_big_fil_rev_8_21_14_0_10_30_7]
ELKLSKGKLAAQVAHASVEAVLESNSRLIDEWHLTGMKKSVLKVKDKKELFVYKDKAKKAGLVYAVISDAGKTEVKPGTVTCMAIGPDEESKIDTVTKDLKLL